MAKKKKAVKTSPPPTAVLAKEEEKKSKLEETKAKREKAKADRQVKREAKAKKEKDARAKSFAYGNKDSAQKFLGSLEKSLEVEIEAIKNPQKMLVILATNMTGEAVTYKELADAANAWMHDSFAVSPKSQPLAQLSPERPIKAFNGRNEIWRMQRGVADICIIKGVETANREAHKDEDDARSHLESFNLIDEAYDVLTPELVGKLKKRFAR